MTEERKKEIRKSIENFSHFTNFELKVIQSLNYLEFCGISIQNSPPSLEDIIFKTLEKLGLPQNRNGFKYYYEAIRMVISKKALSMSNEIYPILAQKYSTSTPSIQFAMNSTMQIAWKQGCLELQTIVFGYNRNSHKKTTNKCSLLAIAKYVETLYYVFSKINNSIYVLLNVTDLELDTLFPCSLQSKDPGFNDMILREKIRSEIDSIHISSHLYGYEYLQDLIYELVKDSYLNIYKATILISQKTGQSAACIDGCIRIAIKSAQRKNTIEFQQLLIKHGYLYDISVKSVIMSLVSQIIY